jgi:hypothetical protein
MLLNAPSFAAHQLADQEDLSVFVWTIISNMMNVSVFFP